MFRSAVFVYENLLVRNEKHVPPNAGFHSELFDLIQNSEYRYTQSLCFFQCLQRGFLSECNCTDPARVSLLPNGSKCTENDQTECQSHLWKYQKDFIQQCQPECPQECYLDSFDVSLSSFDLVPYTYQEYLNSNYTNLSEDFPNTHIDENKVKKSFIELSIFYKTLSYELSTESPQMNELTLFANIASNLGLFLGVSVFSLFEPIQVLIEIIHMKFNK